MSRVVKNSSVYEQFRAVPEYMVAEIVRGKLVTHPRPAAPHAMAASALGAELFGPFRRGRGGPGGWVLLHEPELHLGENYLVPDIAGWCRERMPEVPQVPFFELAPDWICEVLSPSTTTMDRAEKLPIYAEHSVRNAWIVDPLAKVLEVYRLEAGCWSPLATHRDTALVRAEPFDAIEFDLAVLWER